MGGSYRVLYRKRWIVVMYVYSMWLYKGNGEISRDEGQRDKEVSESVRDEESVNVIFVRVVLEHWVVRSCPSFLRIPRVSWKQLNVPEIFHVTLFLTLINMSHITSHNHFPTQLIFSFNLHKPFLAMPSEFLILLILTHLHCPYTTLVSQSLYEILQKLTITTLLPK